MKKVEASVVILINEFDEILLLYRTSEPLGWCLPGGKMDAGESPQDAAVREVREETGINIKYPVYLSLGKSVNGRDVHIFYYRVPKQFVILSGEHTAYMWVKGNISGVNLAGNTLDFIKKLNIKTVWTH